MPPRELWRLIPVVQIPFIRRNPEMEVRPAPAKRRIFWSVSGWHWLVRRVDCLSQRMLEDRVLRCWLIGGTLQIVAGPIARLRSFSDPGAQAV